VILKVLIVGAGEVGFHLAQRLSQENQDVILIESDPDRARHAQEQLDVMTVVGNGASLPILEQAGVGGASMLLAVTSIDEVNLIACLAASRLGVKHTVARISNPEYYARDSVLSREALGITLMISPERACAEETFNLLQSAASTDVAEFADGRVQLVGVRVREGAPVAGKTLAELRRDLRNFHYVVPAIVRNGHTIIPGGNSRIEAGDQVFLLAPSDEVDAIPPMAGYDAFELRRVMIAGGSREGVYLAELLERRGIEVTVLDSDRKHCLEIAEVLSKSLVLHADATDLELLELEGVSGVDGFVAATGNDQTNLLSSLLAKTAGARKVIALIQKFQYLPLVPKVGVDAAVSPRMSTVNAILRYVRRGRVMTVATLKGIDAEAIEFRVGPGSRVTRGSLRDLHLPKGALVGTILRDGEVLVPTGDDTLQSGDEVVVFALPEAIHEVESFFQ